MKFLWLKSICSALLLGLVFQSHAQTNPPAANPSPAVSESDRLLKRSEDASNRLKTRIESLEESLRRAQANLNSLDVNVRSLSGVAFGGGARGGGGSGGSGFRDKNVQGQAEMMSRVEEVAKLRATLTLTRKLYALSQKVNIECKGIDIRTAIDNLNQLTSLKVIVDDSVPRDIRITTTAKDMPLGSVLEIIANTANLSLFVSTPRAADVAKPTDSKGFVTNWVDISDAIVLAKQAPVKVSGKSVAVRDRYWPWIGGWSAPEIMDAAEAKSVKFDGYSLGSKWLFGVDFIDRQVQPQLAFGMRTETNWGNQSRSKAVAQHPTDSMGLLNVTSDSANRNIAVLANPKPADVNAFTRLYPSGSAKNDFPLVTSLGSDTFIISELGLGPKGERGLWLTVFMVKRDKLVETSRYFHRLQQGAAIRPTDTVGKKPTKLTKNTKAKIKKVK